MGVALVFTKRGIAFYKAFKKSSHHILCGACCKEGTMVEPETNAICLSQISPARLTFHALSFLLFLYVFCWHFGSEAATFSQSQGFGWFFKYLTFCGFTFQMTSIFMSFLSDLFPQANTMNQIADDLSCASFGIANVITVMFWCLLVITKNPVDQHVQKGGLLLPRPPLWLSLSLHLANAIVAWIDIFVAKRTFSKASFRMALMFGTLYTVWIQICSIKNKAYPYPFLNTLPQPEGLIGMVVIGLSLLLLSFKAGAKVAYTYGAACNLKVVKSL